MTIGDFRRIALSMPGASENSHMAHPDFRANGKIFATLGYPDKRWGMVKLTAEQQREFVLAEPQAFIPVKGTWGAKGATSVRLDQADEESLGAAMTAACRNVPVKPATKTKSKPRAR
jgi:hypothetical protein